MNICLIRPPKLMLWGAITPQPTPPLGMAYIAGALKSAGHRVTVIDCMIESPGKYNQTPIPVNSNKMPAGHQLVTLGLSPEEILARVPANTDIIGFSCMFSNNWLADRALLNFLGDNLPNVTFIAGGESITALANTCLTQAHALKVCVLGEGEETVIDLVNAIETRRDLSTVAGIVYKQDGNIVRTGKRTRLKNLEQIPPPAWELFRAADYEELKAANWETSKKTLPLMATRGCPYSCTFCTSPDMWGTRYYMRSPLHVADEIEYLKDTFGITNFDFYDLTAIIKKEWIIDFAKIIVERKLDITWRIPAGTRSEAIDDEVARWLYASGCWSITYAPESGSPRMLKLIKKKVKLDNMLESMRYSHKEKMRIYINMILALPDEKHSDIWKTLWFLVKCSWVGVDDMGLAIFRPYPGSVLFDRLEKEGALNLENDDFFVETIFIIDTILENSFYNTHVGKYWYRFYDILALVMFYGSNYIFRPARFVKSVRNIITHNHELRVESRFAYFLKQLFSPEKKKQLPPPEATC